MAAIAGDPNERVCRNHCHARTLAGVTLIDVLPGLLIGVVAMLVLVIYEATRSHASVLGEVPGVRGAYRDVERHPDYQRVPGLLVLRLAAPPFYANATLVRDRIKYLVGASDPVPRVVILEPMANDGGIDITRRGGHRRARSLNDRSRAASPARAAASAHGTAALFTRRS
jgi:MFS superfamily sulfate permease-like transporter